MCMALRPYAEWIVWQAELTVYSHVTIQIKWRWNIHGYIHNIVAKIWYPHMDISMDISMDIHIHGNPGCWSTPSPRVTSLSTGERQQDVSSTARDFTHCLSGSLVTAHQHLTVYRAAVFHSVTPLLMRCHISALPCCRDRSSTRWEHRLVSDLHSS